MVAGDASRGDRPEAATGCDDRSLGPVPVVIASDLCILREGLAFALQQKPSVEVLGVAVNLADILAAVRAAPVSVVLLDIGMSDSLAAIREATATVPALRVVAMGLVENELEVIVCAEAGIAGYVPPEGSIDDLVAIIQCVARGELLCSPRVAGTLLRRVRSLGGPGRVGQGVLTPREQEIARLLADGLSNKAIAHRLSIHPTTVKNHVHHILDKLQLHRRSQVAARVRADAGFEGRSLERRIAVDVRGSTASAAGTVQSVR